MLMLIFVTHICVYICIYVYIYVHTIHLDAYIFLLLASSN